MIGLVPDLYGTLLTHKHKTTDRTASQSAFANRERSTCTSQPLTDKRFWADSQLYLPHFIPLKPNTSARLAHSSIRILMRCSALGMNPLFKARSSVAITS